jgi:hypothetical protein
MKNDYSEYFPIIYMYNGEIIRVGFNENKGIPAGTYCLLPLFCTNPETDLIIEYENILWISHRDLLKGSYFFIYKRALSPQYNFISNEYTFPTDYYSYEEIEHINKIWNEFYDN